MTTTSQYSTGPIALLGPQIGDFSRVKALLDRFEVPGKVALITTGWQENEGEDESLSQTLQRPTINLALHARSEIIIGEDPEFANASASRQKKLQHIQSFYRVRLESIDEAAAAIGVRHVDDDLLDDQEHISVSQFRHIDAEHLTYCKTIWRDFEAQWNPAQRPAIKHHRQSIAEELDKCDAIVIAGGHVAALLNRLRLFDVLSHHANKPIIAWSAGAMALTDRVILFHDSPPFGKNLAQVLDVGLGLCPDVVAMPDFSNRVITQAQRKNARFARRMAPARSFGLDAHSELIFQNGALIRAANVIYLQPDGGINKEWSL